MLSSPQFLRPVGRQTLSMPRNHGRSEREKRKDRKVEFSGGQWARLSLARTMMRASNSSVDLLLFDEPSASLDPRAEHGYFFSLFSFLSPSRRMFLNLFYPFTDLFERLETVRQNKTTIYSTHRFGSFNKKADLILYM